MFMLKANEKLSDDVSLREKLNAKLCHFMLKYFFWKRMAMPCI